MRHHTQAGQLRHSPRRRSVLLLLLACFPLLTSLTLAGPAAAVPGDLDWGTGDSADYDHWTPEQYNRCVNDQSTWPLSASTLGIEPGTGPGLAISGIVPSRCYSQYTTITNDLSYPINLRYVGSDDAGTIAPYIFEWVEGWNEQIVAPGAQTTQFTLTVGMPWDTPNAARGTSGTFWWEFAIDRPVPTAVDDAGSTGHGVPATIEVLANDTLELAQSALDVASYVSVTEVVGNPAEGTWAISPTADTVTFTPAAGFAGIARASYTITGPNGTTSSAAIAVTVAAANLTPTISLQKTVDKPTVKASGETVTYNFTVTNTGEVALADVGIVETTFTGSGRLSAVTCPAEAQNLAPAARVTCTASYRITDADIARGGISNTATAVGTSSDSQEVNSDSSTAVLSAETETPPPPAQPRATGIHTELAATGSPTGWPLVGGALTALTVGAALLSARGRTARRSHQH
ncbi:hypothetical protein GCM10022198_24680 [Klugiella xanthotipulae]|nr:Ig-like domain-containing protein [Klugiella xanthotipulae]